LKTLKAQRENEVAVDAMQLTQDNISRSGGHNFLGFLKNKANIFEVMIRVHLNLQEQDDLRLLLQFRKQASSVSNYLAHKPLPIQLPDGQYAAIFATQHWIPKPGFEMYDTRYIGTHKCFIELNLCIVRKPRHQSEQAQAIKCIQKALNFGDLLPSLKQVCRNISIKVHISQKRCRVE
jgi:hypothetical protein